MISLEDFKKKPLEVFIVQRGEHSTRINPVKKMVLEQLEGNLYTYRELSNKLDKDYSAICSACKYLERKGVVTRVIIDGQLYVGLTAQIREIGTVKKT